MEVMKVGKEVYLSETAVDGAGLYTFIFTN